MVSILAPIKHIQHFSASIERGREYISASFSGAGKITIEPRLTGGVDIKITES